MNKKVSYMLGMLLAGALFTSCKNGDADFPDYEGGTTVYFPYQTPVRTIVLGDDEYDTTLDKLHMFQIKATFGGSRSGSNGNITVVKDPTLLNNLTFEATGQPVKLMPDSYYDLPATTKWEFNGTYNASVEIELSDDFFNDPDAVKNTYVIPLVITEQAGFDRILKGTLKENANPTRTDASQWEVLPMDYVLYCVKFQNKYSGYWLTHGTTSIDNIEKAQAHAITTKSLNQSIYRVSFTRKYEAKTYDKDGNEVRKWEDRVLTTDLLLTFDGSENCTISSLTPGYTAIGTGKWEDDGAKKSWNNKDRDLMELNYTIDFGVDDYGNAIEKGVTHEKMVWQRSGVKTEEFAVKYN